MHENIAEQSRDAPNASRRARREFYRIHTIIYSAEAFPASAGNTLRPRRAQAAGGQDRGIAAPSLQATTAEYLKEFAVCGKAPHACPNGFYLTGTWREKYPARRFAAPNYLIARQAAVQHSPEQELDEAKTKKRRCVNKRPTRTAFAGKGSRRLLY
jgi:hypothetical protein